MQGGMQSHIQKRYLHRIVDLQTPREEWLWVPLQALYFKNSLSRNGYGHSVKGKSGTGFAKPQDTGAGAAPAPFGRAAPAPFHFDVEWIELWSATKGSSYFNTKRSTSQTQRPICFPSSAPLHQSPIALRAKSIVHPAFLRKSPSPKPSAAACFIDPEEPAAAAAAAAASPAAAMARPSPPQQTFPDFFACLQKHRSQLGGDRFAASVPEMKRYTGACICDDVLARA